MEQGVHGAAGQAVAVFPADYCPNLNASNRLATIRTQPEVLSQYVEVPSQLGTWRSKLLEAI